MGYKYVCENCGKEKELMSKWRGIECPFCKKGLMKRELDEKINIQLNVPERDKTGGI